MNAVLPANYIRTTLDGDITSSATSMTLSSVSGFPTIANDDYFYLVLIRATDATKEIVKVTAVNTTTKVCTIERAQDGTVSNSFCDGDYVQMWVTKALLLDLQKYPSVTLTVGAGATSLDVSIQANDHPDALTYTRFRMWLIDDATDPNQVTLTAPDGDSSTEWSVVSDEDGLYTLSITHSGSSTTWYLAVECNGRVYVSDAITLGT